MAHPLFLQTKTSKFALFSPSHLKQGKIDFLSGWNRTHTEAVYSHHGGSPVSPLWEFSPTVVGANSHRGGSERHFLYPFSRQ